MDARIDPRRLAPQGGQDRVRERRLRLVAERDAQLAPRRPRVERLGALEHARSGAQRAADRLPQGLRALRRDQAATIAHEDRIAEGVAQPLQGAAHRRLRDPERRLDNLYGYGATEGRRTENSPMGATGRKGLVRVRWDARLRGETLYQWDRSFLVSDEPLRKRFPELGTSIEQAVRDTAALARPQSLAHAAAA